MRVGGVFARAQLCLQSFLSRKQEINPSQTAMFLRTSSVPHSPLQGMGLDFIGLRNCSPAEIMCKSQIQPWTAILTQCPWAGRKAVVLSAEMRRSCLLFLFFQIHTKEHLDTQQSRKETDLACLQRRIEIKGSACTWKQLGVCGVPEDLSSQMGSWQPH